MKPYKKKLREQVLEPLTVWITGQALHSPCLRLIQFFVHRHKYNS